MQRILVIEDDDILREGIVYILRSQGFEVFEATDGYDGVELAQSLLPDLITCDINLPGYRGREIAEILANYPATATIPIVFITAGDPFSLGNLVRCAYTFLEKPFEVKDLVAVIYEYL
jgi:CheY-like chemotaxis protein